MWDLSRRDCLRLATSACVGGWLTPPLRGDEQGNAGNPAATPAGTVRPKAVAGVVTVYHRNSHADVILGKILEGWQQDGGTGPALRLAALYVDQFPASDISREVCARHGVPIFDSIEKTLTLGGDQLAVDGVLSIGEHGTYPSNDRGQHLYPRRRFFAEIADTLQKHGRSVPVFNDKHLGPLWPDARWMYDRARELRIPLMAGSSLVVGQRSQELNLPRETPLRAAVGIGYGGIEAYGFHALEFYQCHVERRRGGERGVTAVQFLQGDELWRAVDAGRVSRSCLDAALAIVPKTGQPDPRQDEKAGLFLFDYADGFTGAVLMLGCVRGTAIGLEVEGQSAPLATAFEERTEPRFPHFAYLLKALERMFHTGTPSYPVERTLLTSGILHHVMESRFAGGRQLATPQLAIAYQPVDYPSTSQVQLNAPPPVPRDEPLGVPELVERVIAARGGRDKLLLRFRFRERYHAGAKMVPPGTTRESVMEVPGAWWIGKTERGAEPAKTTVWAWTLRILLDPKSQLERLPEITDDQQPLVGLRVRGAVNPPLDLYFVPATWQLARIDWRNDIYRFAEWKEQGGVQFPAKCTMYRRSSGEPWFHHEILELEPLTDLPPDLKAPAR